MRWTCRQASEPTSKQEAETRTVRGLEKDIAVGRAEGHDDTTADKARRVLQRLVSSTNRRMHLSLIHI